MPRSALVALVLLPLALAGTARGDDDDDEWDEPRPKVEPPPRAPPRRVDLRGHVGSIPAPALQGAVRGHLPEVRFCFDRERQKRPDLAGRVHVRFVVSPAGQVERAEVESSTVDSPAVENCLVAAVRRWTFPRPAGGSALIVYPFSAMAR